MYLIKDTVAKILANLEEIYNDKKNLYSIQNKNTLLIPNTPSLSSDLNNTSK